MLKLLFPTLTGTWRDNINLNKYAKVIQEDVNHNPFLNPHLFGEWINLLHKTFNVDYSWGGYLEDREEILDGTYLSSGNKIHLGVDFWVPEHTPVYLPQELRLVQSRYDDDMNGGWGGQVIFEINSHLYLIFGHLKDIVNKVNTIYPKGSVIGLVGGIHQSGGWYPHLHLQCMRKFDYSVDGYGPKNEGNFQAFPDPMLHIGEK